MQPISSTLRAHPAQEQMIMRREAMRQKTDALLVQGGHEPKRIKTEDEAALLGEEPRLNSWDSNAVLSFPHLGAPLHNAFDNQSHFHGMLLLLTDREQDCSAGQVISSTFGGVSINLQFSFFVRS